MTLLFQECMHAIVNVNNIALLFYNILNAMYVYLRNCKYAMSIMFIMVGYDLHVQTHNIYVIKQVVLSLV